MRKKNYKGAKVSKRVVAKCEGVCRTYDAIQYAYANLLSEAEEVKLFQVNVLLQGLEEGAYTSDFVITKSDVYAPSSNPCNNTLTWNNFTSSASDNRFA